MRRSTPRQIAQDVVQSLAELISNDPKLRDAYAPLRDAFILGKPAPPPARKLPCKGWPLIECAVTYAGDVMRFAQAGDTVSAWTAAARASYWQGVALGMLSGEAGVQDAIEQANLARNSRRMKTAKARAARALAVFVHGGGDWREQAREIFNGNNPRTNAPWSNRAVAKKYIGKRFAKSKSQVNRVLKEK